MFNTIVAKLQEKISALRDIQFHYNTEMSNAVGAAFVVVPNEEQKIEFTNKLKAKYANTYSAKQIDEIIASMSEEYISMQNIEQGIHLSDNVLTLFNENETYKRVVEVISSMLESYNLPTDPEAFQVFLVLHEVGHYMDYKTKRIDYVSYLMDNMNYWECNGESTTDELDYTLLYRMEQCESRADMYALVVMTELYK
jgi:ribosomal protein S16